MHTQAQTHRNIHTQTQVQIHTREDTKTYTHTKKLKVIIIFDGKAIDNF